MGITLDFTNVEDNDFAPLPDGIYNATLYDIEVKQGKKYPYFKCEYRISNGEFEDRRVWDNLSTSPKALWRLKQVLGRIAPELDLSGKLEFDPDSVIGLSCRLKIVQEEYKGDMKNKVEDVLENSGGAGGTPSLEDADVPF